jgi:hypothetical protein
MKTTRDELFESFFPVDQAGTTQRVDSVFEQKGISGTIEFPSYYGFGFMYDRLDNYKLTISADYVLNNWSEYSYYGQKDLLRNSTQFKMGAQFVPDITGTSKNFWSGVIYRTGFLLTREPYTVTGDMNSYGITFGAGFPIKKYSYAEINRSNIVNTSLEFGQRNNRNSPLRENYFRFTVGFSFSDIWFIKRKYD